MATEKRALDKEESILKVSSVIVDIEGTTTSISFVHDTLFPYVREHLNEYVKSNWADAEFQEDLKALKEQAKKDETDKIEGVIAIPDGDDEKVREATIKNVIWQMDKDMKTGALKQLQGHIWRKGYEKGEIVGHIYDDVHESLKSWVDLGKKIYVYSSGSVEAQKLLFGHTKEGDLLKLFSGHFDTAVGAKTEAASYAKILEKIEKTGDEAKTVLFLTDVPKEAAAAVESGMLAVVVTREGNAPLTDDVKASFQVVSSFADLAFEGKCKRRKVSETEANTNNETSKAQVVDDSVSDQNDVEMKEVDKKVDDKPIVDDSKQKSNEEKTVDSAKEENDSEKSTETKMDTSEVVEQKSESDAKDGECVKKPVEAMENGTEEKSEKNNDKSDQAAVIESVETTKTNDKSDENCKQNEKDSDSKDETKELIESCKKTEEKENAVDGESKKMDEDVADETEKVKVQTTDEKEGATEEKESASNEEDSKVSVAENVSADKTSEEKVKEDDKCLLKKEENSSKTPDKTAKPEAPENTEMNDDSGIADVNKSVNQSTLSEKSDDVKTEALKDEDEAKVDVEASEKKSVDKVEAKTEEAANGKLEEAKSKEQVKNEEKCATEETKLNGNKDDDKEAKDSNEETTKNSTETVQNGVSHLKNGDKVEENVNGDSLAKHDETEAKTDVNIKENGNQIAIEEKKLDSINNTTETVAV